MSSLSRFPVEILECITGMVVTSEQMRLWQCGDRILNTKLKQGGVKRTSLCWSSSSWLPWPSSYFTIHDGLEHVEWGRMVGTSLCPALDLRLLPNTLRSLRLECDDVFILLRNQNVKLSDLFPFLGSLHLSGERLHEENLHHLPPNLHELSVQSPDVTIESSIIFQILPKTIQRLCFLFDIVDTSEYGNDLPTDLVDFHAKTLSSDFTWTKFPSTLKSLTFSGELDWDTLPRQLETLIVLPPLRLSSLILLKLPQSLKCLEGAFDDDFFDEQVLELPKNLTRFHLQDSYVLTHSGLEQLPSSLTDLSAGVLMSHPDILSFYPPQTRQIDLRAFDDFDLNPLPLPIYLHSLKIEMLSDDICAVLPPSLTLLDVTGGHITAKGASKFPASLTRAEIYLRIFDRPETLSYLSYIPNLEFYQSETSVDPNWLSFLRFSLDSPVHSLPRYCGYGDLQELKSLSVVVESYRDLPEDQFKDFPRFVGLKTMNIEVQDEHRGFSGGILRFVPRSVTDLKISQLSDLPTESELETLPKCLQHLHLDILYHVEYRNVPRMFNPGSLPRSLVTLRIDGALVDLTGYADEDFPPYIQTIEVGPAFDFVTPLDGLYGFSHNCTACCEPTLTDSGENPTE